MIHINSNVEYGHPPLSHHSSREIIRGKQQPTITDTKHKADNIAPIFSATTNEHWNQDLLRYHSKARPITVSSDLNKQEAGKTATHFPLPEIHLSPFPDSEYSSILRGDITSPVNSDDPTNSGLTPVNTPNVTRAHGHKRGSDIRSLNSIVLLSRPRMGEPSPFDAYSSKFVYIFKKLSSAFKEKTNYHNISWS